MEYISGFVAGTKVLTKKGSKAIEKITTKDYVRVDDDNYQKVKEVITGESDDIYQLSVLFQPDTLVAGSQQYQVRHKTEDGYGYPEWCLVKDVAVDDLVATYIQDDCASLVRPVKGIKKFDGTQKVYSLKVETHRYTANGIVTHD